MFFELFPQKYLLRDAGHYVHSSVLRVEMNSPLQTIKELSTLENNFAFEAVLEKCIQAIQVLVVEKNPSSLCSYSLMLPIRIM